MSGVKHTPGKWLAAAKPSSVVGWPVVAAPMGQVICDVAIVNKKPDHISDGEFSASYAQVEANACLIASAPDLLETGAELQAARKAQKLSPSAENLSRVRIASDAFDAALARARGEQSPDPSDTGAQP